MIPGGLREEGREEGHEEGLEQGENRRNIAIVQSLIQETDFDNQRIAKIVGVSEEVVEDIRKSFKN